MDELERFLHAPIQAELGEFQARFEKLANELRESYLQLQQHRRLAKEVATKTREAQSLSAQIKQLKEELTGIDEDDRSALSALGSYKREEQVLGAWRGEFEEVETAVRSLLDRVPTSEELELDGLPNQREMQLSTAVRNRA